MTAPVASGGSEFAGWDLHPLENAVLSRRTSKAEMSFRNWVACTTAESGITFWNLEAVDFQVERRLRRRLHL